MRSREELKQKALNAVRIWKWHWAEKEPGYKERALNIDANMVHHLASLIADEMLLVQVVRPKPEATWEGMAFTESAHGYDISSPTMKKFIREKLQKFHKYRVEFFNIEEKS